MAKLFGEFLIDSNLVTVEQVLDAVMAQMRSVPSTAEVIYDHSLLPAFDIHRILVHQQYSGADFRSSAAALELWSQELAQKVSDLVLVKRRPLGEVLVELGYISLNSLTQALDAYVEAAHLSKQTQTEVTKTKSTESPLQEFNVKDPLDPILIKEFIENFSSVISPELNNAANLLDDPNLSQDTLTSLLRSTLSHFTALRAAATFLSISRTEGLAKEIITTLTKALSSCDNKGSSHIDIQILQDIFKIALHVFGAICVLLEEFGSEEGIDADLNIIDLTKRLQKAQNFVLAQISKNIQAA